MISLPTFILGIAIGYVVGCVITAVCLGNKYEDASTDPMQSPWGDVLNLDRRILPPVHEDVQ